MLLKFTGILVLLALAYTQTPPVWPNQFEINFDETTKEVSTFKTKGKIIYDWTGQREVVTREDGRGDRYCNTVEKFTSTPCNHYILAGKRYLDFPTKKYCCYCCNSTNGCGVTKPDWMSTAQYLGVQKIDTENFEKWDIKGLQDNYYYNTLDSKRVPRRLDQHPDDVMDFDVKSYKESITNSSIFTLPSYCTATCGLTTICATLRGETPLLTAE